MYMAFINIINIYKHLSLGSKTTYNGRRTHGWLREKASSRGERWGQIKWMRWRYRREQKRNTADRIELGKKSSMYLNLRMCMFFLIFESAEELSLLSTCYLAVIIPLSSCFDLASIYQFIIHLLSTICYPSAINLASICCQSGIIFYQIWYTSFIY